MPLLISLVALFVALGGPSYAADLISGKRIKNRSISGKKLKANSIGNKAVKESALGKVPAAAQADSADTATSANTANTATSASTATNSTRLGGIPAGGYTRRLFAVYDAGTNSIVRGAGAVSVEAGGGPGARAIRFDRAVSSCSWIATRGDPADGSGAIAGFITTELSGPGTDQILVRTRTPDNISFEAVDFHLVVVC
ncbi:MAG: hypothetical protein M3550_06285 [Actinomycetota bacterium]|nr:hypothetical protein [Actinomycetota bacterium]